MRPDTLPRKLAAILYADVAAYSRLTGKDEEDTHRRPSEYLDLISSKVEACQGRVVHYAGDAVLADFPSVMTAIDCAVDIQEELADRNSLIPFELSRDSGVEDFAGLRLDKCNDRSIGKPRHPNCQTCTFNEMNTRKTDELFEIAGRYCRERIRGHQQQNHGGPARASQPR